MSYAVLKLLLGVSHSVNEEHNLEILNVTVRLIISLETVGMGYCMKGGHDSYGMKPQ